MTRSQAKSSRCLLPGYAAALYVIQPMLSARSLPSHKGASKMLRATGHARMITLYVSLRTLSNLLSARSLLSHRDAARDGPCAHGNPNGDQEAKKPLTDDALTMRAWPVARSISM